MIILIMLLLHLVTGVAKLLGSIGAMTLVA